MKNVNRLVGSDLGYLKFGSWERRLLKIEYLGNASFKKCHLNGIGRKPCEDKGQDRVPGKKKAGAQNHIPCPLFGNWSNKNDNLRQRGVEKLVVQRGKLRSTVQYILFWKA